nr:short chain dehydrogenase [Raoultella sp. NCTC 9187]
MQSAKLFFITGVSSGFGRALAEEALSAGHRVVGTLRNESDRAQFEALSPVSALAECWMSPICRHPAAC